MHGGVIQRYRRYLPVRERTPVVTLGEGSTPLLPLPRLARKAGLPVELLAKVEGTNPTGSFKDRGMTLAVSLALEAGAAAIICASTGNTAASASAYGARAGLRVVIVVPEGGVALGKLAATLHHGARLVVVKGSFDKALSLVQQLVERHNLVLVNSVNPHRVEGQKTAAFEICDELGDAPQLLAVPVGNAGNITAYWRGFSQYLDAARIQRRPILIGCQAAGAAPLVVGHPIDNPETVATAIRIGRPASREHALRAVAESGGQFLALTDDQILEAYDLLAREEGIFVEPASAASVAGILRLHREGRPPWSEEDRVACVLTGHGLKDPERALSRVTRPEPIEPELGPLERAVFA